MQILKLYTLRIGNFHISLLPQEHQNLKEKVIIFK